MNSTVRLCITLIALLALLQSTKGQVLSQEALRTAPFFFKNQFIKSTFHPKDIEKKPGHYSRTDWSTVIDSTWGEGLPTDQKLTIFDTFWTRIDENYACFQDLDVDWDSLKTVYRSEIENSVSKGRFAAIMNHLARALQDAHTICSDKEVNFYTSSDPGVPLFWVGGWGDSGHFGAGLTPLPDSSLLVYKAIENHPLALVPGDIVLGYDGIPWKILYQELLTAELPLHNSWWGSSESSYLHSWLMSAGLNWHLYDTIDIVQYISGDTLHLATDTLASLDTVYLCSEQMDISGVLMPDYFGEQLVSYGIMDSTEIGYIYVWGWFWDAEAEFYNAIYDLMNNYTTTGLIIDFRMNFGGNMFLSDPGLKLLFNTTDTTIGFAHRSDPNNHFAMTISTPPAIYVIRGDTSTFYDKPIAVLTGPGAVSAGDQVALRMKFHPKARFFGKSTTTAFNGPESLDLGNDNWVCRYAKSDAYLASEPDNYLTHDEFEVDVNVWHNPDDVAQGKDAVVQAAVDWIDSLIVSTPQYKPPDFNARIDIFPNPFTASVNIKYEIQHPSEVQISIYNHLGKLVAIVSEEHQHKGKYQLKWNSNDMASGIYYCVLKTNEGTETVKIIKLR